MMKKIAVTVKMEISHKVETDQIEGVDNIMNIN